MSRARIGNLVAALTGVVGVVVFTALKTKKGQSYTAKVGLAGQAATIDVCDSKGKIRLFTEMDAFFAEAAKALAISATATSTVTNLDLMQPAPFTGDIIKKNQGTRAAYQEQLVDGNAVVTKLTQEITLLQGEPSSSPAYIAEKQAQKAAVEAYNAWLTSEVARITTALGS